MDEQWLRAPPDVRGWRGGGAEAEAARPRATVAGRVRRAVRPLRRAARALYRAGERARIDGMGAVRRDAYLAGVEGAGDDASSGVLPSSLAFAPRLWEGHMLCVATESGVLEVVDARDASTGLRVVEKMPVHFNNAYSVRFAPDAPGVAVTASADQTACVLDLAAALEAGPDAARRVGRYISGHSASVRDAVCVPGSAGRVVVTSTRDGVLQLVDLRAKTTDGVVRIVAHSLGDTDVSSVMRGRSATTADGERLWSDAPATSPFAFSPASASSSSSSSSLSWLSPSSTVAAVAPASEGRGEGGMRLSLASLASSRTVGGAATTPTPQARGRRGGGGMGGGLARSPRSTSLPRVRSVTSASVSSIPSIDCVGERVIVSCGDTDGCVKLWDVRDLLSRRAIAILTPRDLRASAPMAPMAPMPMPLSLTPPSSSSSAAASFSDAAGAASGGSRAALTGCTCVRAAPDESGRFLIALGRGAIVVSSLTLLAAYSGHDATPVGEELALHDGRSFHVRATWHPSSQFVASGAIFGPPRIWETAPPSAPLACDPQDPSWLVPGADVAVTELAWASDGTAFATCGDNAVVQLWRYTPDAEPVEEEEDSFRRILPFSHARAFFRSHSSLVSEDDFDDPGYAF
jgi:WD40 repeat protein